MTGYQDEHTSGLISTAMAVADEVETGFGKLTPQQLNWKPSANQWSIAQCLDHVVTANESYFPIFDRVIGGDRKSVLAGRLPWLPAFWGKLLIKAVSPETSRKSKAPKIFHPASSSIEGDVIRRFTEQQNRVIGYIRATEDSNLEKVIVSSPVTPLIFYSLMDACRIIVAHEERHLLQAKRVLKMRGFPG